jgi:hypothetical protein
MTNLVASNSPCGLVAAIGGSGAFVTVPSALGAVPAGGTNSGVLQQGFGPPCGSGPGAPASSTTQTGAMGSSVGVNQNFYGVAANAGAGPQGVAQGGTAPPALPGLVPNN